MGGSRTLPAHASSIAIARRFVAEFAEGLVEDTYVVVLLTSELVSNVVRHTDSEVRVEVHDGPPLRVEVHDGTAATEAFRELIRSPPPLVDASELGGRGLRLVHDLASRVGLDDDPDGGKVVWFEV